MIRQWVSSAERAHEQAPSSAAYSSTRAGLTTRLNEFTRATVADRTPSIVGSAARSQSEAPHSAAVILYWHWSYSMPRYRIDSFVRTRCEARFRWVVEAHTESIPVSSKA